MTADVEIESFLSELGLEAEQARRARAALEESGLTNPRKQRLSAAKLPAARAALDARFARLCRQCAPLAGSGREVLSVRPERCERCGGSANRRALDELASACTRAGVRRMVVVGGSPSVRRELATLAGALELRLVDGTERRTSAQAANDLAWADLVVVCGASELAHRVSTLYTRERSARLVVSPRRGVEAIAESVLEHLARGA